MSKKKKVAKVAKRQPKTQTGFRTVVLHFGYVESSCVSPMLVFCRAARLATKLDAVKDVARWFFQKWMEDTEFDFEDRFGRDCCVKARAAARPPRYCGDCGEALDADPGFDVEYYQRWLLDCQAKTADGFGWDGDAQTWSPWCQMAEVIRAKSGIVEIVEHAEEVLTYALDPRELPKGIDVAIAEYRATVLEHHGENRLRNRKLDIDGIINHEAKAI